MRKSESSNDYSESSSEDERQRQNSKAGAGGSKKSKVIVARPNASNAVWLSCLLPLALLTNYFSPSVNGCARPPTFPMLCVGGLGMCIESLCFFFYLFVDTGLLPKLLISFVPGTVTTLLYMTVLQQSWRFGLFWGFAITFCYQNAYIRILRGLPRCFSYGEAAILVQGLMLFLLNGVLQLPSYFVAPVEGEFNILNAIMISALFCLVVACWCLATFEFLRTVSGFYALMCALLTTVMFLPITASLPIVELVNFIFIDEKRVYIILFYLCLVGLTICTVWWQQRNTQKASTRVRKIFHLLIVLVLVPGMLYQCHFLYIATGVALALITVLELFRICDIPPLGHTLKNAFTSFSDEKDAGLLALTPFCLLIGCASPIWISNCPCSNVDAASGFLNLPLLSGILSIGFGDTAASVVGSKIGRIKWRNSNRSLEGSIAFIISIVLAVYCFDSTGIILMTPVKWVTTLLAALITALVEAHTDQIDNLVLPLVFYIIVNLA